jgi:hypothetical protein
MTSVLQTLVGNSEPQVSKLNPLGADLYDSPALGASLTIIATAQPFKIASL